MIIDVNTRIWTSLDQLGSKTAERLRSKKAERWGQFEASLAGERPLDRLGAVSF